MIRKVEKFFRENHIELHECKILVGVSGGVDSMVLVYALYELGANIEIAHVNYHLRGKDSDRDQEFVRKWCQERGVVFNTIEFDTKSIVKTDNESVQMVARRLRYTWFNELDNQFNYDYIATAHHLDDSFETTLFNLIKGSGIKGLRGILSIQDKLIRPLIYYSKDEIIHFANEKGIKWREDVSNSYSDYQRNYLRNEVIPLFKRINPSLTHTYEKTRKRLLGTEKILAEKVEQIRKKFQFEAGLVTSIKNEWLDTETSSNLILSEILDDFGFNYSQCEDIFNARKEVGKFFTSDTHKLTVDRGKFDISEQSERGQLMLYLSEDSTFNTYLGSIETLILKNVNDFQIPKETRIAALDYDKLSFPLLVRNWQQGDKFRPLGMSGFKKMSDFLIDEKVSSAVKDRVTVVISGNDICWVPGYRVDDRFKITEQTENICLIKTDFA